MGIEGGHSIENCLGLLRDYYRLGVRYMTLTWSNSNGWADSSGDIDDPKVPHTKDGLTDFGKDVVYEMNRLGMMVDISHVSDKTFYRTLIISRAPVIASHSSARALCNAPRNMDDNMLRAVGQYGGVVMVNYYSSFLSQDYRRRAKAQQPAIDQAIAEAKAKLQGRGQAHAQRACGADRKTYMAKIPRPPLSVLIDHIDHIAKIAGIDHVGLGSDFDGIPSSPEGMDSAADLPKITQALHGARLQRRGHAQDSRRQFSAGLWQGAGGFQAAPIREPPPYHAKSSLSTRSRRREQFSCSCISLCWELSNEIPTSPRSFVSLFDRLCNCSAVHSAPDAAAQTPPAELPDMPTSQAPPTIEPTGPTAVLDTSMGRITCKLFEKEAPLDRGQLYWAGPGNQAVDRSR